MAMNATIHPQSAPAGRRKRPQPRYRQPNDGTWLLEVPVTDCRIIADLNAAAREQQRREFEALRRSVDEWLWFAVRRS
jgi:hypothetical protein